MKQVCLCVLAVAMISSAPAVAAKMSRSERAAQDAQEREITRKLNEEQAQKSQMQVNSAPMENNAIAPAAGAAAAPMAVPTAPTDATAPAAPPMADPAAATPATPAAEPMMEAKPEVPPKN